MKNASVRRSVVGFDSAWTDKPNTPGAVCIISCDEQRIQFYEPQLASFDQALKLIHSVRDKSDVSLVALDQPTIVPNLTSMRPVDRVAASIISWAGGGVQPANRSKVGMFDDAAPIWRFKERLGATEDPDRARDAEHGLFLIEVFPALALLSIGDHFFGRLKAPRYNPARRKTFKSVDWIAVLESVAAYSKTLKLDQVSEWCEGQHFHDPRKAEQDKLDSVICALIGYEWLHAPRSRSVMLGDMGNGYMITPASATIRARFALAGERWGVPVN